MRAKRLVAVHELKLISQKTTLPHILRGSRGCPTKTRGDSLIFPYFPTSCGWASAGGLGAPLGAARGATPCAQPHAAGGPVRLRSSM